MKINLLAIFFCSSLLLFSAPVKAERKPSDNSIARKQLLKLSPEDAYLKIRKLVLEAKRSKDIAPYVVSDLSLILYEIAKREVENPNAIYKVKNMITAFPAVRIIGKKSNNRNTILKVIPGMESGWTEERTSKYEFALVTMNFDGGVWKFKNAELKKISPWCFQATELDAPSLPLRARIAGKKYHGVLATQSGNILKFKLEAASSHEQINLVITAPELSQLNTRFDSRRVSEKIKLFKRPLKLESKKESRIFPHVIVTDSNDKEILAVKTGFGLTLKFRNYRKIKLRRGKIETLDGSILLRLPDKHKSYIEGNFRLSY